MGFSNSILHRKIKILIGCLLFITITSIKLYSKKDEYDDDDDYVDGEDDDDDIDVDTDEYHFNEKMKKKKFSFIQIGSNNRNIVEILAFHKKEDQLRKYFCNKSGENYRCKGFMIIPLDQLNKYDIDLVNLEALRKDAFVQNMRKSSRLIKNNPRSNVLNHGKLNHPLVYLEKQLKFEITSQLKILKIIRKNVPESTGNNVVRIDVKNEIFNIQPKQVDVNKNDPVIPTQEEPTNINSPSLVDIKNPLSPGIKIDKPTMKNPILPIAINDTPGIKTDEQVINPNLPKVVELKEEIEKTIQEKELGKASEIISQSIPN
jgi:hypothetical protein